MNTGSEQSPKTDIARYPADDLSLWIREHKTVAMLGAFAIGVFLGALTRR